jgi:hypothetical protein
VDQIFSKSSTYPTVYRSIIGGLQYLFFTHPDITFSINKVYQFMDRPLLPHWQAVAYLESDWAGDSDECRYTSAYCIFIGKNLISWQMPPPKVNGCSHSLVNSGILPHVLLFFGVTTFEIDFHFVRRCLFNLSQVKITRRIC